MNAKGRREHMRKRVTSYEVAKLAGVSQPAVSRAFTPGASIAKEKRDRVLAAAKQLNYVPNVLASSLSTARSNMVAVISGSMSNPFYSESLQAFVERFQDKGKQVLAFSVQEGRDCDDALMQAMRYPVDGIVITSAHMSSELIGLAEGLGIPMVMFNRRVPESHLASIHCDNEAGSKAIARIMHAAGARRYLVVRGDPQGSTSRDRVAGFRSGLGELGPVEIEEIDGASSYAGALAAISSRFSGPRPRFPDAVFAVNDIMAIGCADALRGRYSLAIPHDVMLAGFDGIREAQRDPYRLTTVRQPIEQMVAETIRLLEVEEEAPRDTADLREVLPGELIRGETVPEGAHQDR